MEIETSTWMMIFFIIALVVSIWKIYAFLPNKELEDDDRTKESQEDLLKVVLKVIKSSDGNLNYSQLYMKILEDDSFDKKRFWRFNQNKLKQLLNYYHLENPHTKSINDIYKHL